MKSTAPPTPEICLEPITSAFTWPLQVHLHRRVHGDEIVEGGDDAGVVGDVCAGKNHVGAAAGPFVKGLAAEQHPRHMLARASGLAGAGDDAGFDERHATVVEQAAVQTQVVVVLERVQNRCRNRANAGLQAVAVAHEGGDVGTDGSGGFVEFGWGHLGQRARCFDNAVERRFRHHGSARGRGDGGVEFRDYRGGAGGGGVEIRIRAEAKFSVAVPGHLHEGKLRRLRPQEVEHVPQVHGHKANSAGGVALLEVGREEERLHAGSLVQRGEVEAVDAGERELEERDAGGGLGVVLTGGGKSIHEPAWLVAAAADEDPRSRPQHGGHVGAGECLQMASPLARIVHEYPTAADDPLAVAVQVLARPSGALEVSLTRNF